jgi:murein DD-endopeptidase MepM/ murein hydrolase activator NlpD
LKRRFLLLSILFISALTLSGTWLHSSAQGSIVIGRDPNFEYLRQGTVGVLTLGGPEIIGGSATVFGRNYPFFPTTQGFSSLLSVPLTTRIGEYPLQITIYRKNGSALKWEGQLRVESGEFIAEDRFILPKNKVFLLNPGIQSDEDSRLLSVYSVVTPAKYWTGPFTRPVNGPLGSSFGAVRTYNDGSTRRHTGIDITIPSGTPMLASSNGRVVYARHLDIHGNNIIIDHGWGVFSEYAHLSEIYVVPGQFVLQGDIIGLSGNTGRSTGPHTHWEIAVNGTWVSPLVFAQLKLPN